VRVFKRGKTWYCYVYEDGRRRQRSTFCHDKKAAETVARRYERDAADPDHAATRAASLSDALALLIRTREEQVTAGRRSASTLRFYQAKAGHWVRILETFGEPGSERYVPFPLARFGAAEVDRYISARRGEGVTDHTISKELVTVRCALALAKRARLWRGDLDEVLPVAFAPDYTARTRHLSIGDLVALLRELLPDRAARVAFIVATSAGWSESESAHHGDVAEHEVLLRGTKRASRWRVVPIEMAAQRDLMRYALEHAAGQGGALFTPWGNVRHDLRAACRRIAVERVAAERGESPERIRRAAKRDALLQAELAAAFPPVSPNDLRRTFAHIARAHGIPLELVSPMMGHTTTIMVQKVYGKRTPTELAARVRAELGRGCIMGASDSAAADGLDGLGGHAHAPKPAGNAGYPVPRDGIEPPTRGFSILCSTN
jgi:hypothetical protein